MPEFKGNPSGKVELLHNPHQFAFLDALDAKTKAGRWAWHRLILRAGRQGGKTKIGSIGMARKAGSNPNGRYWACAPTFPKLNDYVFPALEEAIPRAWIKDWAAQNWTLTLQNDAIIQLRSLDDITRGRGPGLDGLWIDEARDVHPEAWHTLEPTLLVRNGQAWLTTTPQGKDWCYRVFWLRAEQGTPGYWAVRYRTADNPKISAQELEEIRQTSDPTWFAQEYLADIVVFSGAVYGATLESQIIRDTTEEGAALLKRLIPEWPRIAADRFSGFGLDPGADHPFAGSFGVRGEDGHVVLCGEYLQRDKDIAEHARLLRSVLDTFDPGQPPRPQIWPIDKSQRQNAIELAIQGIHATAAPNAVMPGITRVKAWLAAKKLWFVESRVPQTIEQLRNYRYAETQEDAELRKERVVKKEDDLPDAVRYLLMAWPDLPSLGELPEPSGRSLRELPEEVRWQVERMRRCDALERGDDSALDELDLGLLGPDKGESPFQDFYG